MAEPDVVQAGHGETLWVAGDTCTFKVTGDQTANGLFLFETSTPPGGGPPPHMHLNDTETFFVLEGTYEILIGNRSVTARAGDTLTLPPGLLHTYANRTPSPARMLTALSPGELEGFFRAVGQPARSGEAAPPPNAADFPRFLEHAQRFGMIVPAAAA